MKKNTTSIENLPTYGSNKNEKYMWLNNTDLQISPEIQRKLEPMRVAEIQRKFDPLVANPVKVSYRDGQYFIFEGMHTRTALCGLNKTDDFPIFCRVYFGLTKEDEARLFATQFGVSKPVRMADKLRALEVAKDPDVLDFLDITRSNGFTITLGGHSAKNGNIAATVTAFKVYGALGSKEYGRMLKILHKTWAGTRAAVVSSASGASKYLAVASLTYSAKSSYGITKRSPSSISKSYRFSSSV